jgi:hypothetical protein
VVVFSLTMSAALLVAVLIASGIAEAQRGGGGRGGGGFGKPPGNSKPSSEAKQSPSAKSGEKGAGSGVYSPGYGVRHGSLSNFFLWAWIFHDLGDDDYEEEYGETNAGFGGWALMGVGALGVWFLVRNLRRRLAG